MFGLTTENSYLLFSQPTDMRKGFAGLSGIVRNQLERDPCNGEAFIFINRQRNKLKLLQWQGGGFVLYYKQLEKGTFELPVYTSETLSICLDYAKLVMLVDGLSIKNLQKRKRYHAIV